MGGFGRGRAAVILTLLLTILFLSTNYIKPAAVTIVQVAERARLKRLTVDYAVKETENFLIRFSDKDIGVIRRVEYQAQKQFDAVTEYFGYNPETKITLTVYQDKNHLQKGLRLPYKGTTLGAYYAGTISVLSPSVWGHEGDAAEEGLYIHELTHLIMSDMAGGNYPMWFTEGMALYQEYINTGFEWGREYKFEDLPYSIQELTDHFAKLDQFIAYKQSFLLVKTLVEREGRNKVFELLETLKGDVPFDLAFERVYGYSPDQYENSF